MARNPKEKRNDPGAVSAALMAIFLYALFGVFVLFLYATSEREPNEILTKEYYETTVSYSVADNQRSAVKGRECKPKSRYSTGWSGRVG